LYRYKKPFYCFSGKWFTRIRNYLGSDLENLFLFNSAYSGLMFFCKANVTRLHAYFYWLLELILVKENLDRWCCKVIHFNCIPFSAKMYHGETVERDTTHKLRVLQLFAPCTCQLRTATTEELSELSWTEEWPRTECQPRQDSKYKYLQQFWSFLCFQIWQTSPEIKKRTLLLSELIVFITSVVFCSMIILLKQ